jgi:uncharacterized membrane protein YdjX (TVP38/TMEM64 family)
MNQNHKSILGTVLIFLCYLVAVAVVNHFWHWQNELLKLKAYHYWAPILFVLFYVLRGFFYFPSLVFLFLGAALFPFVEAVLVYLGATLLSGLLSYWIGAVLSSTSFFQMLKKKIASESVEMKIKKEGAWGVFFLHLIGFLDAANYLAGFFKVSFLRFLVAFLSADVITTVVFYSVVNLPWIKRMGL